FASLTKSAGLLAIGIVGIVGAVKAARAALSTLANGVRDASKEVDAIHGLNVALALSGKFSRDSAGQLVNFANDLQKVTNVSAEAALGVATLIQNLGKLEPDQLQRTTKAALDLATALKIDVNTAAQLRGRAATGNVEAFTRYGITIQKTGDQTKD